MNKINTYAIEAIQKLIDEDLKPGDRLPSEKELSDWLEISRSTVRDALARLDTEGVIEKRWGVGTFVAARRPPAAFGILSVRAGIPGLLASTGGKPSVYRFGYAARPPDPEKFPDFPDIPVLQVTRVFALDGIPAVSINDQLVSEFNGRRVDVDKLRSIDVLVADVLEEVGIDLKTLDVEMLARDLDTTERQIFGLSKSEPVIKTRGKGQDADMRHILSVSGIYRTSVITLRYMAT